MCALYRYIQWRVLKILLFFISHQAPGWLSAEKTKQEMNESKMLMKSSLYDALIQEHFVNALIYNNV